MRKNVFTRVGRPPSASMGSSGRVPHPKGAASMMGNGASVGLGGSPLSTGAGGGGPMQGLQTQVPGAAFRKGGSVGGRQGVPRHHDNARLAPGRSEFGHLHADQHFAKMCRGGKS